MNIIQTLLSNGPALDLPQGWLGWTGWAIFVLLIVALCWEWRRYNQAWRDHSRLSNPAWLWALLLVSVAPTTLFLGIRLPATAWLTPPQLPMESPAPFIMLLSAIPWMLAAGFFGPTYAAITGFLSGLCLAIWGDHNPFTPLGIALLALIFGVAIRQRYRTPFYRLLRSPVLAAILLALIYPFIYLIKTALTIGGSLVNRLDYSLVHLPLSALAMAIGVIIGSLFVQGIALAVPRRWGVIHSTADLLPSPAESSLQARFLYNFIPWAVVIFIILTAGDWIVADRAARELLWARMQNNAQVAAESVPYFIITGKNQIKHLASTPARYQVPKEQLLGVLEDDALTLPFFSQLILLDANGDLLSAYPDDRYTGEQTPTTERDGITLAKGGLEAVQLYNIAPNPGDKSAQISFIATIFDRASSATPTVKGVLVGRTKLSENPFFKPTADILSSLGDMHGEGLLVDGQGYILVGPEPKLVMTTYTSGITRPVAKLGGLVKDTDLSSDQSLSYEEQAPDGTRYLGFSQQALGTDWKVIFTIPASQAQQLALRFATPLLGTLFALSIISVIIFRLGLNVVTRNLKTLSAEAGRIAEGQLDQALQVDGEDEVSNLRRSFEQMRLSLKARLDELNRLLAVSQGVASRLDIHEAIQPALEAALATGASVARLVLAPNSLPELDSNTAASTAPTSLGIALANQKPATTPAPSNLYQELDQQILAQTRQQDRLVLSSLTRPRLFALKATAQNPASLLAIALRHEQDYYGALWIGFEQPHQFSEEELRFMVTLAGQTALAVANTRHFMNAEIGRQRLAAIVDSTPDPVMVIDQQDHLLLANLAACQVFNLNLEKDVDQPIGKIIAQKELLDILHASVTEKKTVEVILPLRASSNGQVYLATASSVTTGQPGVTLGRVCILRDVTRLKELDGLKSDFLNAVSHDLRSPLTQIRGYATMLDMVGPLNDQQTAYVQKITQGADDMSHLVSNLLDLNRIQSGIELQLDRLSVYALAEKAIETLHPQTIQKKISIVNEIPPQGSPIIEVDAALFQQALFNLLENAVKYTRSEGKVQLRCQVQTDHVTLIISDNGMGISPVDLPHLFEKFFRGAQPSSSKDTRGIGLGLAIVKSIIERHNGKVSAESQLGRGSTFYLTIPHQQPKTRM